MTSKVILKKKNSSDPFGYLGIRYFNGRGEKKVLSLGERLEQTDFDEFFNSDFNRFQKTTKIDYKSLNKKIEDKINDFSIFDNQTTKKVEKTTSFLTFFKKYIDLQPNPQTRNSFSGGLNKLEEFKTFKKYDDILFSQIDNTFVLELRNYFLTQLSGNTTKQYLNIIKVVLNQSKKDGLYKEQYNYFSKLKIDTTYNNKKILSEKDIQILLEMKPNIHSKDNELIEKNKYYETRNMLLFSILCSGLRVSDLLLIKNRDFKNDCIEIITKKTSLQMKIPYNDKLLGLLLNIYNLYDYTLPWGTGGYGINVLLSGDKELNNNKNKVYNKNQILEHIKTLPENDFLFKKFMSLEPSLNKYSKLKEMTEEQNSSLNRLRSIYNYWLKEMIKHYDFEIKQISSHTGRYSWTNLLLNIEGVNLVDLQRSLGHKRLSVTELYIEKNFGLEKLNDIGSKLSDKLTL
jgi:integrase